MKRAIRIFILALLFFAALDAISQTIAKGDIICDDEYYCYTKEYYTDSVYKWMRFDTWEYYASYNVKIDPNDSLETIFVNARTSDTTYVKFIGQDVKRRFKKNLYLDGTKQIIK